MNPRILLLGACALALTACTSAPATTTAAPASTVTSPSTVTSSSSSTTTATTTASAPAQTPPASTVTATTAPPASPTGQPSSSTAEKIVPVDPSGYKAASGRYEFGSPSGNFECANAQYFVVGCQSTVTVGNIPNCEASGYNSPYASIREGGKVETGCSHQGIFNVPGGAPKPLAYGTSITVPGKFTCVSRESGISCENLGGPGRFTIAKEAITTG